MQSVPVKSSMIASVGYEPGDMNGTLVVTFNNGRVYNYENVPEDEYTALVNAPSVGKYFLNAIKDQYRVR